MESFNFMTIVIPLILIVVVVFGYKMFSGVAPGSKLIVEDPPIQNNQDPNQATFMFFYTTWCPHCKKAQQPWSSMKELLKTRKYTYGGKTIFLEEINAESDKGKSALYKMKGPPSTASFRAFLISALGEEKVF